MILLDTSFLYALTNTRDKNHGSTVALLPELERPLFLPTPVLPELCYLLQSRLGHHVMRRFLRILSESEIRLLALIDNDIESIANLLDRYAGTRLDFADAAIVAIAERYGITRIATFDRRDFSIIRPRHTAFFELLP
jgi:predicted nucleic acid-binding protein